MKNLLLIAIRPIKNLYHLFGMEMPQLFITGAWKFMTISFGALATALCVLGVRVNDFFSAWWADFVGWESMPIKIDDWVCVESISNFIHRRILTI